AEAEAYTVSEFCGSIARASTKALAGIPELAVLQVAPLSALLKTPKPDDQAYTRLGFCGSIARPFTNTSDGIPEPAGLQLAARSVLLYTPKRVPAYSVVVFCGSTTREGTGRPGARIPATSPGRPPFDALQLVPPSVLLNTP